MLLWILFAFVTAGVLLVILRPVASGTVVLPPDSSFDVAVYRDQLAELDRDEARGLMSPAETDAARNEIGRRLLRAGASVENRIAIGPPLFERRVLIASLALIPLAATTLYLVNGNPGMPGVPYQERLDNAVVNRDTDALIAKVENHLAQNPADVTGWLVVARAYRTLGRFSSAAHAFAQAASHSTPDSGLLTDYGEMLVMEAKGTVTSAASSQFSRALALDAANPRARFYRALEWAQAGARPRALAEWKALLRDSPAEAPWRQYIQERIDAMQRDDVGPELTEEQMAAAKDMSAEERNSMIGEMVQKLADRLEKNGNDLEGWLRLARARMVLGQIQQARAALDRAGEIFKGNFSAMARIDDVRKSLPQ